MATANRAESLRSLIKTGKPNNSPMQEKKQGQPWRTKITKAEMYEIRWNIFFGGMNIRQVAAKYGLEDWYIRQKVMDYQTMGLVIPKRDITPEQYRRENA